MQELALLYFSAYSVVTVARPAQRAMGGVGGESSLGDEAAKTRRRRGSTMDQISGPLALTGPYTQTEAARLLVCSERAIQRLVETGKLRTVRAKGRWMVPASEITRLASSSPAAPPALAPVDTPTWLRDHLPAAERWWKLWLADREALRLASEVADNLPEERGDRLLLEHGEAERSSSLGYMSELLMADQRAERALEAHDVRSQTWAAIASKRARLAELIAEVIAETNPSSRTKP
jgi:excisionase family DNA binding protein